MTLISEAPVLVSEILLCFSTYYLPFLNPRIQFHRTSKPITLREEIRPLAKIDEMKNTNKGRRKGKSIILTSKPMKNQIKVNLKNKHSKLKKEPKLKKTQVLTY